MHWPLRLDRFRRTGALAANALRSNLGPLPHPYKLTLAVTEHCTMRCATCAIWRQAPRRACSFEELERLFTRARRFNWIDLTGGEPFLREDLVEVVRVILSTNRDLAFLHLPTNGTDPPRILSAVQGILALGPPRLSLTVSLDGDEALNDRLRGRRGAFRLQLETYRRLHALPGVEVVLGTTLSRFNVRHLDDLCAAVAARCPWFGPNDLHLNLAHRSEVLYRHTGSTAFTPPYADTVAAVHRHLKRRAARWSAGEVLERSYLRGVEPYLHTGSTPLPCRALTSSCFIDAGGTVFPCTGFASPVGRLAEHDFDLLRLWRSDRAAE
ncbi:MAG: hypothetical protein A2284_07650, partial [Deltaproteobacteria bacterium RIFOXYA12_FULL_61_11]